SSLSKLESSEKSAASALNKAGTRKGQVAATKQLASAYSGAAGSLRKPDVSPADTHPNTQLVAALSAAATACAEAAGEGARKDRAGYKREGGEAQNAGKDIKAKLNALNAVGYKLPAATIAKAAAVTKLPTLKKDPVHHTPARSSSSSTSTQT